VTLADPRGAITNYDALLLLAPGRSNDARLRGAIAPLIGAIDLAAMRKANDSVDRDADKLAPREAARRLLSTLPGLSPVAR
jgi:osmoprotectant transport system permease protein